MALEILTPAALSGAAGFLLVAAWPLLKGRRALLVGQAGAALAFLLHYLLIGATTGAAMSGLSIVQTGAAFPDERRWWHGALYAATVPALAVLVFMTWAGPASACAAVGLALTTAARWLKHPLMLRLLSVLACIAWAVHDVLTGSALGLLADIACMVNLYLFRERVAVGASSPAVAEA